MDESLLMVFERMTIWLFLSSAFELLDHPKELARQLTLIDHGK